MGFNGISWDLMGFNGVYPLVMTNSLLLKMAIEIVDFPMKNGGSFHSYVNVYQRVNSGMFTTVFNWWFGFRNHKNSLNLDCVYT